MGQFKRERYIFWDQATPKGPEPFESICLAKLSAEDCKITGLARDGTVVELASWQLVGRLEVDYTVKDPTTGEVIGVYRSARVERCWARDRKTTG